MVEPGPGIESPDDPVISRMIEANRANWDARAPVHAASAFYGVDGSREQAHWFAEFEWVDLPALEGIDVLHLQCHIGSETIVLAGRGARTVGLDISGKSLAEARRIAERYGVSVEYVQSDVYGVVEALGGRTFDVVYTGKGALCYVPDLDAWAAQVAALVRPGGVLYVVEFHPVLYALGLLPPPDGSEKLMLRNDCIGGGVVEFDTPYTYTDGPPLADAHVYYEWRHGIGEVITAVVGAGLRIERLRETERLLYPRWSTMIPAGGGWFQLPDGQPRIPLVYALLASKPAN